MTHSKVNVKAIDGKQEREAIGEELNVVALGFTGLSGAVVGMWSLACVVGGIISEGGVVGLARTWLSAVTGL